MKKIFFTISVFCLLSASFSMLLSASGSAQETTTTGEAKCSMSVTFLGIPTWYKYLELQAVPNDPNDPSKGATCQVVGPKDSDGDGLDISKAIVRISLAILDILVRVAGMVAFGFIVYGGFQFVLSTGDPQKAKAARETIINAVIGLGIAILATGIVAFIGNAIIR